MFLKPPSLHRYRTHQLLLSFLHWGSKRFVHFLFLTYCAIILQIPSICATSGSRNGRICAPGCTCYIVKRDGVGSFSAASSASNRGVKCHWPELFNSIPAAIDSGSLPTHSVVHLDLSGNTISKVNNGSFASFSSLEKLNLARNRIDFIADDAFLGLENLKFLNLSENNLRVLRNSSFTGLDKLEKLVLSGNYLSRLHETVFELLVFLEFLDLSRNPLICDCQLHWIVNWTSTNEVQLNRRTSCRFPSALQGIRVHKLTKNQWHCNWPLQVPTFELHPSAPQMVFVGDPLQLHCRVSNVEATGRLFWQLDDHFLEPNDTDYVRVEDAVTSDGDLVLGTVSVKHLSPSHQGVWSCNLETDQGNRSRSVTVRVVSVDSPRCPPAFTSNNKGRYAWPQALAGVIVELPCDTAVSHPSSARKVPKASQVCDDSGEWHSLDTSECPYVSEVTKVLEQFAKTDLSIARTSVIENVQRLRNYTGNGSMLHDKMDLVYITSTIYKYLEFVTKQREVGELLIDLISMVMHLDQRLLLEAQIEDRSCSRLVKAIGKLSELTSEGILRHRDNLAVEDFVVKVESFSGITCASYVYGGGRPASRSLYRTLGNDYRRLYRCKVGSVGLPPDNDVDEILETSIRLPASLFHQSTFVTSTVGHKLQFTFFHDASLFPRTVDSLRHMDVITSVVGSHHAKFALVNLTDPVTVTIRSPIVSGQVIPVWWDFDKNGKRGDWSSDGCKLRGVYGNLVSFECNRLAIFGLLQDTNDLALLRARSKGVKFRILHPVIYVGGAIGVNFFVLSIITYILGFSMIHMPKKNKHGLMNTWLGIVLLCLTFTLSVRHTEDARICQCVGLTLHYLSLVVLFWFLIMASNIHKKLTRNECPEPPSDEPPPDYPLPPKPMMRFYLVGWGIPLIVCGISGAVHLKDYAGRDYCFLSFTHSIGVIYGPCGVLVFFICIYYLRIHCAVYRLAESEKRSEMVANLDGTDIELVECVGCDRASVGRNSDHSSSCDSNEDDGEHSAMIQLRAQAASFILFLICWTCAAFATDIPLPQISSFGELLFGSLFAVLFSCLSVLVFVFHCVLRNDVRIVWRLIYNCKGTVIVRDTQQLFAEPSTTNHMSGRACNMGRSDDSLDSCFTSKSCSTNHSANRQPRQHSSKFCNVTAAMANAGGVTDTSWSGEMFYNPYQNGVARKFFRKHSRRSQHQQRSRGIEDYSQYEGDCARLDDDRNVNCFMQQPSVNFNLPVGPKKVMVKASRVVCHDRSVESQLVSSSSQGIVSISPSHSGNCSDRSLLIVKEEDEDEDGGGDVLHSESPKIEGVWNNEGCPSSKLCAAECIIQEMESSGENKNEKGKDMPVFVAQQCSAKAAAVSCNNDNDEDIDGVSVCLPSEEYSVDDVTETWNRNSIELDQEGDDSETSASHANDHVYAYVDHSFRQQLVDVLRGNCDEEENDNMSTVGDSELHYIKESVDDQSTAIIVQEQKLKKETAV